MSLILENDRVQFAELHWMTNTCPESGARQVVVIDYLLLPRHRCNRPRAKSYWVMADTLIEMIAGLPLDRPAQGMISHDIGAYAAQCTGRRMVEVPWKWNPQRGLRIALPFHRWIDREHTAHFIGFLLGRWEDDEWYPEMLRRHKETLMQLQKGLWDRAGFPPVHFN